jgi:CxxC motif-containing protein
MADELICITCPLGCHLSVERMPNGELAVSGNKCPRGARYAQEEYLAPKRVVTATCRPDSLGAIRVPVRTTQAFPKERVDELLKALYALKVKLPVQRGDAIIKDALGTGIDVIAARTVR